METAADIKKDKIHLKYGIIAGLSLIVLFVLFYALGVGPDSSFVAWIPPIVFMLFILIAQFKYARWSEDTTFGNVFAKGFKTTAVATCIFIIFLILFILLVPAYKESVMEITGQNIAGLSPEDIKKMDTTPEQLQERLADFKSHFMLYQLRATILKELILGLMASFVGAVVTPKNKKPELRPL